MVQSKGLSELGREEEQVQALLRSSQPRAGYNQAMRSRFEWHGSTYNIATCNLDILRAWLRSACAAGSLCSAKRADVLDVLEDEQEVDLLSRWYAVDSALIYKVLRMEEGAILVRTDDKPVTQEKEPTKMTKKFTKIEPRAPHSPETKPVENMSIKTKRAAIARPKIARPMVPRAGRNDENGAK